VIRTEALFSPTIRRSRFWNRFYKRGGLVARASGWSGGAGFRRVTHARNFWIEFATDYGDPTTLMTKVEQDVERRLQTSRARITDEQDGPGGTFLVRHTMVQDYRLSVVAAVAVGVLMSLKFSTTLNSMLNSPKFCHR
jgi:hypothetical protein